MITVPGESIISRMGDVEQKFRHYYSDQEIDYPGLVALRTELTTFKHFLLNKLAEPMANMIDQSKVLAALCKPTPPENLATLDASKRTNTYFRHQMPDPETFQFNDNPDSVIQKWLHISDTQFIQDSFAQKYGGRDSYISEFVAKIRDIFMPL